MLGRNTASNLKKIIFSRVPSFQLSTISYNNQNITENIEEREITKDRTQQIPVETSIQYLASKAYQITYGNHPVWVPYRRNYKGSKPPRKTRKTCIRSGQIATGNPCPICRDEYLVLHEQNVDLLKQFICPHTGNTLSFSKTGLCQNKHKLLLTVIERAKDLGLLSFDVHFRQYNYLDYYTPSK
ncbi:28S ribosomal protein S18b, mitochondrial [Agrilus planipennis]|uniref:Small ribosomal subunit protein mS40 n=1 Tax=Agrilus planipennis TaxID=224129 RepID=A0A1W4W425_AGRPL|nr:28S ribosomal protein S18b, mitochondrial [Agrilus planipennis]